MPENTNTCLICNGTEFTHFLESQDFFLTGESFTIMECKQCGFRFTDPRPAESSMGRYYESNDYISHDSEKGGFLPFLYNMVRKFTIRSKYRTVKHYIQGSEIMDIGCGTGEFLNYCRSKGMECRGIEPTGKAREIARKKFKLVVEEDFLKSDSNSGSYDCITLWHVLEHIHRLDETMQKIKKLLKQNGVLIIALPNCNSDDASRYEKYWAAYDLPRHIFHFTAASVEKLMGKYDFTLSGKLPQKLDAFYISLLSEKYMKRSWKMAGAFLAGVRSNLKAKNPQFGYSSQIYIIKHKNS